MALKKILLCTVIFIFIMSFAASAAGSDEYQIISSAGNGGSIDPLGVISVTNGSSKMFNITASAGYEFAGLYIDNKSTMFEYNGRESNYTLNNISDNHSIYAEFIGVPQISGSRIMMLGSVGTFNVTASNSAFIDISFDDASEKIRYIASEGKIVVTHTYSSAGIYNLTAIAINDNKTAGTPVRMSIEVISLGSPVSPVVNNTTISIINAGGNATAITRFTVNESDTTGILMYSVTDVYSSLPLGYGVLPDNKGVIAVVNIVPVNVTPTLTNLSQFTILINKTAVSNTLGYGNQTSLIVYRDVLCSNGTYVQVPLKSVYNNSENTRTEYGYDVETPGYSCFTFAALSDHSEISAAEPESTPTFVPTIIPKAQIQYSTITIDSAEPISYNTTMDQKSYTVDALTVFGVLYKSGKRIETKEWPGGIYVYSIDGIAERTMPDNTISGWIYQVNGVSASVMSNNYVVKDGDRIVWYYSESMNYEPEDSLYAFGFDVMVSNMIIPTPIPIAPLIELKPAESVTVPITLPEGVSISSRGKTKSLIIDTSVTNKLGNVNAADENTIIITCPGLQIIFDVSDKTEVNTGSAPASNMRITAEINSVSVKTVPAPSDVNILGVVI